MESDLSHKNPRLILVDCDGVLLDWEWAFSVWMKQHGFQQRPNAKDYYRISDQYENVSGSDAKKYTQLFNESAAIGFLPPLRDSVRWVKELNQRHLYRFHCITSLSTDENAVALRKMNLYKYFGNVFDNIQCLPTGSDKDEALEPFRDTGLWWIEDKPANADVGHGLGLRSILLEHRHNMQHECPYPIVTNWKEIYQLITDQLE